MIVYNPSIEIEHLGRVSSHANRGFVYRNYEWGWARYLGKHHGRPAALLYKSLVTLDMPIRIGLSAVQCLFQTLTGRREKAKTSMSRLKAAVSFTLTGLPAFWKS
jgi:hypothetical protein